MERTGEGLDSSNLSKLFYSFSVSHSLDKNDIDNNEEKAGKTARISMFLSKEVKVDGSRYVKLGSSSKAKF